MTVGATRAAPSLLAGELSSIQSEIEKRHDESIERLQNWVRHPSIAAEDRGMDEGCELMIRMAREAGFQKATRIDTDGHPGVFATLDAGAERTFGVYFMYDVKQADPAEWSSPPFDAAIVDKPGFGKVLMGRGAVNQKGPEAAFLAALHAIRGAGKNVPVNIVLVAEGEEEIGSPHFKQVVSHPDVAAALKKTIGVVMPAAWQDPDGNVSVYLGAKGVIEVELIASGEKWGRGPGIDVHSSNRARLDSPAFHLVQALATLVNEDGDPAIEGFGREARPATAQQKQLLDEAAKRLSEDTAKKLLRVKRWAHDLGWRESLERFLFTPTVNIEGLVAGHTGPGGKTIQPHRAVAKLDLRLVPDMTYDKALAQLKAHLAKRASATSRSCRAADTTRRRHRSRPTSSRRSSAYCDGPGSSLRSCRASPGAIRATSSRVSRCDCPPATSGWATAAARTRRTRISSSSHRTRRSPTGTARSRRTPRSSSRSRNNTPPAAAAG